MDQFLPWVAAKCLSNNVGFRVWLLWDCAAKTCRAQRNARQSDTWYCCSDHPRWNWSYWQYEYLKTKPHSGFSEDLRHEHLLDITGQDKEGQSITTGTWFTLPRGQREFCCLRSMPGTRNNLFRFLNDWSNWTLCVSGWESQTTNFQTQRTKTLTQK